MIKLRLDDSFCDVVADQTTKISEAIETVLHTIPPHRMVTRLSVDGKRFLFSENNPILEESVETQHDVEILTADKAIWAATGYDIALSCIERIQKSIIRSAELFRENDKLNGNRLFVQCMEGLERFLEAITITKAAINLDFSKTCFQGISLAQMEQELQTILKSVLASQQKEDYLELADKIEYELLTNLSTWGHHLKQLRASQNSNA